MAGKISRCNHVTSIGGVSWQEIKLSQQVCETCRRSATNLWLCLVAECHYIGCSESINDHSSTHAETARHHLTINLTTLRIWCYLCECEVYLDTNNPPFLIPEKPATPVTTGQDHMVRDTSRDSSPRHRSISEDDDSDTDSDEEGTHKPRGLTGLQNLGNTCYLNAALQALSNCPPLTRYFLDCRGFVHPDKNPMLSKSYLKMVEEIWHKKRPSYLVPSSIVSGIKLVHPMFRGYAQQDTQEFLRCFMDQIHEELKEPIINEQEDGEEEPTMHSCRTIGCLSNDTKQQPMETSSTSSQSDDAYETCDSAIGSDRCSSELNHSGDENSEVNEHSRLHVSPNLHSLRTRAKRQHNPFRKAEELDGEITESKSSRKEDKDNLNFSKKASDNVGICSVEDVRSDSTEFVDAVAETEPLRRGRHGSKNRASSAEKESAKSAKPSGRSRRYSSTSHGSKYSQNVEYRSVVSDVFDGKLSSSVQCLTCERVSTTRETFQDLSLPIPSKDHITLLHSGGHAVGVRGGACGEVREGWMSWMYTWMRSWFLGPIITLQDCLAAFFSADELKGDNMYSCEKCKKLRNGVKYSKVLELPEVLSIHLKRFRHEFYSTKISTYVTFPLDNLDMKPYLHKDQTSAITAYDLVAVICHHGTAGGGHYTAYCQNHVSQQWYEYDDQYVTEVDVAQVLNSEAYVLFYRKQNDHMTSVRQDAIELMEAREPSLMQFFVSKQWINRFNTFAEPGPITNRDFLCRHGGVPPQNVYYIDELVQPFTQSMWEFLHERFGGGPACNHLFQCKTCHEDLERLRDRQKEEIEQFIKLNEQFKEEDNPSVIYAISMSWFKDWENFVRDKTHTPPGPIDNKRISTTKNGQLAVRHNSDHGQLSGAMWHFLYAIYGGGPELIVKQVAPPPSVAPPTGTAPTTAEKPVDDTEHTQT